MADKKISQLTAASTPLAGTEVLPVVQSGSTVKVAVSDLTAGRAVSALSLASTTGALLATTSGNVGVGPSTASVKLHVQGVATAISGTSKATVLVDDTTAYAANVGGAITFRGKYNTAGDYAAGGYIQAQKTNATDGNDSFDVVLGTRENGNGAAEALRLTDARDVKVTAGNLVVGTSGKGIVDTNGNESMLFTATASAVNELTVANAATTTAPTVSATGGDTNISIDMKPKGTGYTRAYNGVRFSSPTGDANGVLVTKKTSVTTSAVEISPVNNTWGSVVIVNGLGSGGEFFTDLIFTAATAGPTVLSAKTISGSPAARTYSNSGSDILQLAMASGTYDIRCAVLSGLS